jgi:AcrR family transcriptional regulator
VAAKHHQPGPRGLDPVKIVLTAIAVLEKESAAGFTVRKVALKSGCDPMTVLYYFKSKTGLERAMADALNEKLIPVDGNVPWRERLANLAEQYRTLALKYPRTFPLLLQFWVTGPADYRHAEMVYQALYDAGLQDQDVLDFCFGWYASVLGLAAAEAGGLLQPADAAALAEARALPPKHFPSTVRLLDEFARQTPGRVYALMVGTTLDGIDKAVVERGRLAKRKR